MKITEQQAADFYKEFEKNLKSFAYQYNSRSKTKHIDWEMCLSKAFQRFCELYDPERNIKPFTFLYKCIQSEQRTALTFGTRRNRDCSVSNIDEVCETSLADNKSTAFDLKDYEEKIKNCSPRAKALFSAVINNMEEIAGESFTKLDRKWNHIELTRAVNKLVLEDSDKTYEWFVRQPREEIKKALGWHRK